MSEQSSRTVETLLYNLMEAHSKFILSDWSQKKEDVVLEARQAILDRFGELEEENKKLKEGA